MKRKIKLSFLATSVGTAVMAFCLGVSGSGETEDLSLVPAFLDETEVFWIGPAQENETLLESEAPESLTALTGETEEQTETPASPDSTAVQAGLDGMSDCVESMRAFYVSGQAKEIESASDEILAGTQALSRCAINRSAFSKQVMRAGELGYVALQIIAENQMSYNDYYTLLQIVEAEATGGDLKSKQLIANVVMNRVDDPRFPDSIYEVVWQRVGGQAQFSPTADGRIYSCTITDSTIEAVERALNGEDVSEGALFFFARDHSSGSSVEWFEENLTPLYEYGGHEFFTFKSDAA